MPRIEQMYVFVVEDTGPDDEGVVAIQSMSGGSGPIWLPLVGADMARVESLKPLAKGIAQQMGKRVKLIQFDNRQEIEVVFGGPDA